MIIRGLRAWNWLGLFDGAGDGFAQGGYLIWKNKAGDWVVGWVVALDLWREAKTLLTDTTIQHKKKYNKEHIRQHGLDLMALELAFMDFR